MSMISEFDFEGFFFHHSIDEQPNPNMFVMHTHNVYEIFLFLKGDCEYVVEGSGYRLSPYDILIMRPMEFHRLEINSDKPYERIVLQFKEELLAPYDPDLTLLQCFNDRPLGRNNLIPAKINNANRLTDNFTFIEQHLSLAGCISMTLKLLIQLDTIAKLSPLKESDHKRDDLIVSLIAYLNQNLTEPISLDQLESQFFINKFHLNRLFSKATGSTIGDYIIKKRLLLAQKLLRTGYTPNNACKASGFGNYSAFYRAYTKQFGTNPKSDMFSSKKETSSN